MASPIAHTLAGLTIGRLSIRDSVGRRWSWYLFCVVAAIGPDFDFLSGLVLGQVNLFHHGASHSIAAALIFGIIAASVLSPFWGHARRLFVAGAVSYASHLVIDFVCGMPGNAVGQPLLWPFSDTRFAAPQSLLPGILHGGPDDSLSDSLALVFSWHNAKALGIEALVFAPPTLLVWYLAKKRIPASPP